MIDKEFFNSLSKSFLLHFLFVFLIFALSKLGFTFRYDLMSSNIQLVESSVRVDIVAMPRQTLQELKALTQTAPEPQAPPAPAKAETPPRVEAPPSDRDFLKESETAPPEPEVVEQDSAFMEMLRQRSAQDLPKNPSAERRQVDQQAQQRLQELVARGNQISEGVALVGGRGSEITSEFVAYLQTLPDHVRPHWRLPSYLANEGLQCRVRIYINDQGRLTRSEIYQSSGNDEYDRRALEAVRSASPFPSTQGKEFAGRASRGDIVLGFPL